VLWIYGPFIDPMSGADFVPLNTADNWRHFVLGVGMIGPGVIFGRNSNAVNWRATWFWLRFREADRR